ncbi:hypothetical protein ACQPZA_23740 [Pseudonocardia xinjiangensis]|uniref:hypothetical protein n=1 Tax=Pseudonocardia xinjiangensis TaxID=75289 RepID=UPI003D8AFB66
MTPFMLAVQALLDGADVPQPETEPSVPRTVAVATDRQVVIRSLAEQLVCEANAMLRNQGSVIDLVDDSRPGELAFTLSYDGRDARVQTVLSGRVAIGTLVVPGLPQDQPRQLTTEEEVQALLLSLLAPASHR